MTDQPDLMKNLRQHLDALKHNYTKRTEAERSERDKAAVPALVKAKAALQVSDDFCYGHCKGCTSYNCDDYGIER
jgi:hypothetical protein